VRRLAIMKLDGPRGPAFGAAGLDCFAALAMTSGERLLARVRHAAATRRLAMTNGPSGMRSPGAGVRRLAMMKLDGPRGPAFGAAGLDCFAALAMTSGERLLARVRHAAATRQVAMTDGPSGMRSPGAGVRRLAMMTLDGPRGLAFGAAGLDCFAALAMTSGERLLARVRHAAATRQVAMTDVPSSNRTTCFPASS